MRQIILLSDTHHTLDERFFPHFELADEIWHAGDVGNVNVIDQLKSFKPTRGVYGNIDSTDVRAEFPEFERFKIEDIDVLMTHIAGKPGKYAKRVYQELKKNTPQR